MANRRTRRAKTKHQRQLAATKQPRARQAAPEPVDRRAISAEVTAVDGTPVAEPHVFVVVEPIRLGNGEDLYFQSPFVIPFYLLKSKTLRDAAEPKRRAALADVRREANGTLRPVNPGDALDSIENLMLAVILAAAAIEAHANDVVDRLPDDAMVEIPTRIGGERILVMRDKTAMSWLPMHEKLSRAVPLLPGAAAIKGTVAWQKYRSLFRLRNALMHQRREAVYDPEKPSAFGRILLGEASRAPEDAASIIEAMEPGWFPAEHRAAFDLDPAPARPPGPTPA